MALDGIYLSTIAKEITSYAINSRVEKISQPSKDEVIIALRCRGENGDKSISRKLLLSANASCPRINFTNLSLENPQKPPMFCMLLRKHLSTGRLVRVCQNGLDRTLKLYFESVNELGDLEMISLIIEIMGRHSNIILVNANGKVIDSLKRITNELSSVRMILPGITYELPPAQDKLSLFDNSIEEIMERFLSLASDDVDKSLMGTLSGFSPLISREIAYRALSGQNIFKDRLSDFYKQKIKDELIAFKNNLLNDNLQFTVCIDDSLKLRDFTMIDVTQYGGKVEKKNFQAPSELLDDFYASRDQVSRMKQRSNDLLRLIINKTERITKKLALQEDELLQTKNRDELKIKGDLINANIYRISKGDKEAIVENFYEDNQTVTIKLDARWAPARNAQHYYNEYKKAQTAEKMLTQLMEQAKTELVYLDSVFDEVSRTTGESELLLIREELVEQGYISRSKVIKGKVKAAKQLPPLKYKSSDGFEILVGRNNKQNDKLTLKDSAKNDMWCHTQGNAGSHVIIKAQEKPFSDVALTQACEIAAFHSKGKNSEQVAVDYTLVRYVKKPVGAKPGMVIFTDYKTAFVLPREI